MYQRRFTGKVILKRSEKDSLRNLRDSGGFSYVLFQSLHIIPISFCVSFSVEAQLVANLIIVCESSYFSQKLYSMCSDSFSSLLFSILQNIWLVGEPKHRSNPLDERAARIFSAASIAGFPMCIYRPCEKSSSN